MESKSNPVFWRDLNLPEVELRYIQDGHAVRYVPHSHEQWSIGAILAGQSSFLCTQRMHQVQQGDLVLMNANEVHACNPAPNSPWSYYMLYIDCDWIAQLLHKEGIRQSSTWSPTEQDVVSNSQLFALFCDVAERLLSDISTCEKEKQLSKLIVALFKELDTHVPEEKPSDIPVRITEIANHLIQYCHLDEAIEQVAARYHISSSYLSREFKRHYMLTPHAYRLNRRIQLGQIALKNGVSIVEVANTFGFSDQAHFQRAFKERVAATPKQYVADQ